ncbi:UDP-N-acetylmuramoyl-L-alanyl-D-glutamate synthetase [Corynebacterium atypicum]|uniref:UDP-N-acetylmuramoylalanine--D-glutamate ligase n=1 Tax=Corynebacterium atypicum TaxID=191610 RepID=A0ABN4DDD1_9CORY|nr:UDP-N-acetylmuramoyl-L-alanine--D-glutamate ligase [Corynebacterium atypicum]AIG64429.1 UDP-N-acetylmuramoyl-L-alanyl-D-glutamate synthetase [Corynebacterium atypicum]
MSARKVLVAGAGVSGRGVVALLDGLGWQISVADRDVDAAAEVAALPGATVLSLGEAEERVSGFDLVVTSPGWRPNSPLLVAASRCGVEVIGDVELAYRLDQQGVFGAARTWLAVTGTNGKTTTTGMLASIMQASGAAAQPVGNIGVAVTDALRNQPRIDVLVAELSSFQLHWAPTFRPDAGVLLNLADDHLDWHGGFDDYAASKYRVLRGPVAIVGADDARVKALVADRDDVIGFTLGEPGPGQVGVIGDRIVSRVGNNSVELAGIEGIEPAGPVGVLDALAAAAMAHSQNVRPADIEAGLQSFRVQGHRGQMVAHTKRLRWIDNSKATNPHAAATALAGIDRAVWIAGGQLKGATVDDLIHEVAPRLAGAVLLGVDRQEIADAFRRQAPDVPVRVIDSQDPWDAMEQACRAAAELAPDGATVALAPAAASLDMYRGMAHRGEIFSQCARKLSEGSEGEA